MNHPDRQVRCHERARMAPSVYFFAANSAPPGGWRWAAALAGGWSESNDRRPWMCTFFPHFHGFIAPRTQTGRRRSRGRKAGVARRAGGRISKIHLHAHTREHTTAPLLSHMSAIIFRIDVSANVTVCRGGLKLMAPSCVLSGLVANPGRVRSGRPSTAPTGG